MKDNVLIKIVMKLKKTGVKRSPVDQREVKENDYDGMMNIIMEDFVMKD